MTRLMFLRALCVLLAVVFSIPRISLCSATSTRRTLSSDDVDNLIAEAGVLEPAFGADILLKVSSAGEFQFPFLHARMLEAASNLINSVPWQYKLQGLPGTPVDSAAGFESESYLYNIDRQSLLLRMVQQYISMGNTELAFETFTSIKLDDLPEVKCESQLIPDLDLYYRTLRNLASLGDHMVLSRQALMDIRSIVQVAPAARFLAKADLAAGELDELIGILVSRLAQLRFEPLAFEAEVKANTLFPAISLLADRISKRSKVPQLEELFNAIRQLICRMTYVRCGEIYSWSDESRSLVEAFNGLLSRYAVSASLLTLDDIRPKRAEAGPKPETYWRSGASSRLLSESREMRSSVFLKRGDWRDRVSRLLGHIDSWQEVSEPESLEYFYEKSALYNRMVEVVPDGPTREMVLVRYLAFLESSTAEKKHPLGWYMQVREAINLVLASKSPEKRAQIRLRLRQSRNSTIAAYARILDLVPTSTWQTI